MNEANKVFYDRLRDNCKSGVLIARSDQERERELHAQKWFDYRFMSPIEATYLFRNEYQKVYRRRYAHDVDAEEAQRKYGTRIGFATDNRAEFTSFWRARQFADRLGMPYDLFLDAAFEALLRGSFQRIPYINQLYGKTKARIEQKAQEVWAAHCEDRRTYSKLPQYRTESFIGLDAQIAHRKWILDQLVARHGYGMGQACFIDRVLPPESLVAQFGEERVEQAREDYAGDAPVPHEAYQPRQMLPSCAMLPDAFSPTSPECSTCKLVRFCSTAKTAVTRAVITAAGVPDPVEHRRRQQNRDRVSKHRLKRKMAAAPETAVIRREA